MGERLLIAGYDNVFDPRTPVYCNTQNTLPEVLERYWRWYAGIAESVSWLAYLKNVVFSVKWMAMTDLANGDLPVALISLLCPHYQFWRSLLSR
jgi:hypothetical protein